MQGPGFLEKRKINAKWTLYPSGPDIISALKKGEADICYIGLPPAIIGISQGLSLKCIAGGHVEGTVIISDPKKKILSECSGIKEFFMQFSGSAIGTPPKGSIHDVIVCHILSRCGILDVEVKNYAWADFLSDAINCGEISAAAGTPALVVCSKRYGNVRLAVPPDSLWSFNPSYGIVAMTDIISSKKEILRRFLSAHEEACEAIRKNPSACAEMVSKNSGMFDEDFVKEAYNISPKYCASLPPEYIKSTMKFADTLYSLGYIKEKVPENLIFDTSLIDSIHKEKHHYNSPVSFKDESESK
ncbi:ABC transporter substrate-binding protein [Methanomicrobium antiquum]|uniref:ABC transporter substrate-binding protein n=1 Tax=Methanomicrobium antiquum TaxID=487686 RepID=A0AAF0G0T3_9EURY|nr:ABC transporter substrate-binding protein [Methanomicrobium antiquum]